MYYAEGKDPITDRPLKHNIYKLDDICLLISWIILAFLIIRLVRLVPHFFNGGVTGRSFIVSGILAGSFIFLQAVGRRVRKKEYRMQQIITVILDHKSISIANLSRVTGYPLAELKTDLIDLEKHNRPHIVIEAERVSLRIGDSVPISYSCRNCGASATANIRLEEPSITCAYCGSPIDLEGADEMRKEVLQRAEETSASLRENTQLNIPLLIILFMFFWPGAIIYLVSYSMKKNKGNMLFNEVRQRFDQHMK
jgi:DNA-directed RNA polymerase subunit RPC12/RpoP